MSQNQISEQADSGGVNLWDYSLIGLFINHVPDSTKQDIGRALVKSSPLAWGIKNFDKTPLGAGIKTLMAAVKAEKT